MPRHPKNRLSKSLPSDPPPLVIPGFEPLVETSDDGSSLGVLPECQLRFSWTECLRHTLVVGKTGSGKTTRMMIRSIFAAIRNRDMSLVVIDAQRSEEERIIRYTRQVRGKKANIIRLNWLDPDFSTHYWNCLEGITRKSDAYDIASSLTASMGRSQQGDGLYFHHQATQLLFAIIRGLTKEGHANLGEVRRLLDSGPGELRKLADRTHIPELRRFADEVDSGNRNTETSIAEASNHLIALIDERAVRTTSTSELNFDTLVEKPTVLILSLDEEAVDRLRPLTNAFLHRLLGWIVSSGRASGGPLARPLGLFIDEFASAVGKLPDFERRAHTLRKRNAAIFAAVQSAEQITAEYREAAPSVIAAFNHRILIPPLAEYDAVTASSLTGIIQIDSITTAATGAALNVSPLHRPLLLSQEIGSPSPDAKRGPRMTFLLADTPPFQGWLKPAYQVEDERHVLKCTGNLPLPRREPPEDLPGGAPVDPADGSAPPDRTSPAITNTAGWSNEAAKRRLEQIRSLIDWDNTTGSARKWWEAFESENRHRPHLVLRLAEELWIRSATITEFFLSYVYSNTDNIQANLHYLDYTKLKKQEEKEKRERAMDEPKRKPKKDSKKNSIVTKPAPKKTNGHPNDQLLAFSHYDDHDDEADVSNPDEDEDDFPF